MKQLTALLLSFAGTIGVSSGIASVGRAAEPKEPPSTAVAVQVEYSSNSANTKDSGGATPSVGAMDAMIYVAPKLIKYPKPIAMDSFWDKVAQCETGSNWKDGGKWGGGLGIYQGTWENFGGTEFAPKPGKATREEQIIVANRIATLGYRTIKRRDPDWAKRAGVPVEYLWEKEPVGFGGWGCYKSKSTGKYRMAKPGLVAHVPETVIGQKFKWGQKGRLVMDLQAIIGVRQDGKYGKLTWAAHQKYVIDNGLNRVLVPAPKLHVPKNFPARSTVKRCPQYEATLFAAGFPKNQIKIASYVMWKESRCIAEVKNKRDPNGGSYGLMQINGFWVDRLIDRGVIKSAKDLYDPATNAKAAFEVWIHYSLEGSYNYGWAAWGLY